MKQTQETLAELVQRYQAKPDERTFARIYGRFEGLLVVIASERTGHRDDLIQEGALGLLAAVKAFDAARGVPFEAYAKQRIRWAVANYLKRTVAKHHDATVHTDTEQHASADSDALTLYDARERLDALPTALRTVAELTYQGYSGQDVAKQLGLSPGRVSQLKNQLRKAVL